MTATLHKVYVTFTLGVLTEMHMFITQTLFAFALLGLARGLNFTHNAPDNRGKEFIIGYMENLGQDIDVELFITTMRRKNVSVEISAPHFEEAEIHHLFNVSYGMVKQVHFPNTIRAVGSTRDKKGILIESDDEIVIYGVNKEKFSSDAFLGLPVDVLGTDYYIMTYYPPTDQCELLVVGVENNTAVTVLLGDALGNYTVEWEGHDYRKGDEIHINLDRFDTFQLVSKGDLSGTHVTSDKPVSVFSGNKKTKIGRGFSSDHIVEHLTPVASWGKKFVTVPIPHRTVGDYFRFIASEEDTEIKITGGHNDTIVLKKPGDFAQRNIPSHAFCLVTSNKAIFVAQFAMSQPSRFEPSDPSMIIIPPVEQFASDYTFATPKYSFGSYINYFLFIIKAEDSPGLRLNGKPFPHDIRFNWIQGTGYVGGFISIPEGSHNVRHVSPISIFGGYLYGRASLESYGFPTGMRMAPINQPCEPTPTVAGDGLDNDCDGLIDEELCVVDNEDNDEDGTTNEDCAMPAPVDGNWAEWQDWDSCSATCRLKGDSSQKSFRTRRRSCTNPAPAYDGDVCEGKGIETSPCLPPNYCPVDGQWTTWTTWGYCSLECKRPGNLTGTTHRHRDCSNPPPQYGGKQCEGHSSEEQDCTPSSFCPVDGKWSSWEDWTPCSVSCLKPGSNTNGIQMRSRSCANPKPEHGGKDCPGDHVDMKECLPTKPCPVHGKWTSWGAWSPCSVSCLKPGWSDTNGIQIRSRSCANPKPEHGGDGCAGDDVDIKQCLPTRPCPVHGKWTLWGDWTPCSVSCLKPGSNTNGIQMKSRSCTNPKPKYGGDGCSGDDVDIKDCSPKNSCPVHGKWTLWGDWTPCSVSCLKPGSNTNGVQMRSRSCTNPKPEHGGHDCSGDDVDIKQCSPTNPCPVHAKWTAWGIWTPCSVSCLKPGSNTNGVQMRSRSCANPEPEHGGHDCSGDDVDIKKCSPTNPCPVHGKWTSWGKWTPCSLSCSNPGSNTTGAQTRARSCANPKPEHGGENCVGDDGDIRECSPINPCPVNGKWTSWEDWSSCSASCLNPGLNTNGVQMRSRSCANPKPEHGGEDCIGDDIDIKDCSPTNPCPVHGNWTAWKEWTPCSVSCLNPESNTNGVQMRSRSCANPKPEHGGDICLGFDVDIKECFPTNQCPVDGDWSSWEEWNPCSVSCLEPCSNTKGVQIRSRSCANPKPEHGGKYCQGKDEDVKECSPTVPCQGGSSDTGWSAWSLCSVECGGGIRRRHRLCDGQSESSCHRDTVQEDICNTQECVGTMIELETKQQSPPHFTYTKLTDYGYQPNSNSSIVFHVKACSDAHVALSSNDHRVYEVIIGGWSNTKSIIRSNADEMAKTTHNGPILSCSEFKTFHLSWKCGVVALHQNTSNGWVKLMEWEDPSPKIITNIAFTTGLWATGLWSFRGLAMCNCLVSGDPHYTTFDGEQIDFMGTCKYMLSEYRKSEDVCSYAVEVKNERRGSNSKVSFTRLVDVKMFGQVIRLHQQKNVYIDGQLTYLPYTAAMFEVVMSGTYVRFSSKCGLVVEFDGESNAWVRVPSHLGGSFTGICGNCNGLKDDRREVEEYQVADDSDLRFHHCTTDSDFNPCTQQLENEAETQSVCKYLDPANADISPFKSCIEKNPEDAMLKFESCVYDFCAFKPEANGNFDTRLCDDITAFADSCLTNGFKIKWRSADLCPLHCGEHARYNPESSACPPTCTDPEASQKCTLGTLEGCECEHGYLLSNRKCVKSSECGCLDENGNYYPIGATFSADCTTVKQCKIEGEDIKLVVVGTRPPCGRNAECGDNNGQHTCVCKRGYQGDPSHSCHPVYECRSDVIGTGYQGTVSQTARGNDCLPWNTSDSSFKSIGGHRFCRNPNQRLSPWCYIQTEHVTSWEYCDIPMCHEVKPVCEATTEIICSSSGDTFRLCQVEKAKYITYVGLIGPISTAECRNGLSFGRFGNSIWTDHGCGGYFEICFTQKKPVYNIVAPPKTECKQTDSGEDYTGRWGRTLSGRVCQRWNSQYPHNNTYSTSLNGEVNYCRNPGDHAPGHTHSHPWCYTTDENKTWEYCSIPNC
ncbi:uncharacterized protein LOC117323058 [Pecten maximus]|uniref:uncharacterized protein LOC117323058 n=1 Tax=Pecten maximus TaxID=6579 RepID=UPI0014583EA2|nr:uncharacterized protein LOC117323058 [Pecten maximus]